MVQATKEGRMSTTEQFPATQEQDMAPVANDGTTEPEKTDSPASLKRQVTDLSLKVEEMEKLLRTLMKEKPTEAEEEQEEQEETEHEEEQDDSYDSDRDSSGKTTSNHEDADARPPTSVAHVDNDVECEASWKVRYVPSNISWPSELKRYPSYNEDDAREIQKAAIVVYYEYDEGSTTEPDEPPRGKLPVRVRINSEHLSTLLEDITGITLPKLPYTALSPYKVFMSHYEQLKKMNENLEASFATDFDTTVDDIAGERPRTPPYFSEVLSGFGSYDSFETRKRDILLLRCFVEMSEKFLAPLIALQSHVANQTLSTISYANLWFIYQPGDIIFGRNSVGPKTWNAYQVFCVTGGRPCVRCLPHAQTRDHEPASCDLKLYCYSWRFDGSRFVPTTKKISIPPFDGEKRIKDLPYFPKRLCKDDDTVLRTLIDRGNKVQNCRYGHGNYDGTTLPPNSWHINEDCFIDFKSGYEMNPDWLDDFEEELVLPARGEITNNGTWESRCGLDCSCEGSYNVNDEALNFNRAEEFIAKKEHILKITDGEFTNLDENKLVMLPPKLLGYGLRSKQWFFLNPDLFEMIDPSEKKRQQAFDDLVLPDSTKDLLRAMVKTHAAKVHEIESKSAEAADDIDLVKGKGKGLIIFLYGPPGVGKTSTAETIAAYSTPARPLYPITCGDLGSNPIEVQEKLDSHFTLAHRWKCVLLLDEADVYLAERNMSDLSRNGIVSVFLRNLEYYAGILFLTSNREGLIDEAFKSRIHVALRYKAIDKPGTLLIWSNIMRKIIEENANKAVKITFNEKRLLKWARNHFEINNTRRADSSSSANTATWNGRQIRNAFQTAISLASFERLERIEDSGYTEKEALARKKRRYTEIQLTEEHFETVATVVGEFEDYLVECRGADDAERAYQSYWRKDNYDPTAPQPSAYRESSSHSTPRGYSKNSVRGYPDRSETPSASPITLSARRREVKATRLDVELSESDRRNGNGRRGSTNPKVQEVTDVDDSSGDSSEDLPDIR